MGDDIQRTLGNLEAGIQALGKQQETFRAEQRADNKLLFDGINKIAVAGCSVGERNIEAIKELRNRPERLLGMAFAGVTVLCTLITVYLSIRGNGL
jgi:hypothetical protein